jgi:hypothetical protein
MLFLYLQYPLVASAVFGISLLLLLFSLGLSLFEIVISTKALEIELSDMEGK